MLKYSLGTLFLVIALVALACTALANFSPLWAEIVVAVTLAILSIGLIAALVAQGNLRVFAIGFAAVGWAYFLLTFVDAVGLRNDRLLTNRPLHWVYTMRMNARAESQMAGMSIGSDGGYASMGGGMPAGANAFGGSPDGGAVFFGGSEGMGMGDMSMGSGTGMMPGMGMDGMSMGSSMMMMSGGYGPVGPPAARAYIAPREMQDIGHALWAIIFGCAGGVLAQVIHRGTRRREPPNRHDAGMPLLD